MPAWKKDMAAARDLLFAEHGIHIQPINYRTVLRGTEPLHITPAPSR
jgi:5-aminolevulinate synthase